MQELHKNLEHRRKLIPSYKNGDKTPKNGIGLASRAPGRLPLTRVFAEVRHGLRAHPEEAAVVAVLVAQDGLVRRAGQAGGRCRWYGRADRLARHVAILAEAALVAARHLERAEGTVSTRRRDGQLQAPVAQRAANLSGDLPEVGEALLVVQARAVVAA